MQKFIKKSAFLILFLLLSSAILFYPKEAFFYALNGLNTWFDRMIPTLFPFMVLTGILIRMQLTEDFAGLFRPFLFPILPLPRRCLYVIIMGFLCGFPMGAKVIGDMYRLRQLSKKEAEYLLSFCNNIGPVFFTGFVFPFLPKNHSPFIYLFGMYGIPLGYGILLRFFTLKKSASANPDFLLSTEKPPIFAFALDSSVSSAIQSITKLGGYMIFFNLINLLPQLIFRQQAGVLRIFSGLFLEITGGIVLANGQYPALVLSMLHFGGICCLMQTYSMISDTDITLSPYLVHKSMQTLLTFLYYRFLFPI